MDNFSALLLTSSFLIPIVAGLVEAAKAFVNTFYAPILSIAFGVACEFLVTGTVVDSPSIGITVLLGVVIGLSSAGLYSGGKKIFGG